MQHRRTVFLVTLSLFVVSCASSPNRTSRSTAPSPSAINAEELRSTGASNLYDAISLARPTFFASRGATSILNEPVPFVVIVNRTVRGGLEQLRSVDARIVRSVRRLSSADVYQITGKASSSGGVEVVFGP